MKYPPYQCKCIVAYYVKEIFYTLQGEGCRTGRPAVFCRFSGCNLWNGIEKDREAAKCDFCDTDFNGIDGVDGGKYCSADELATAIADKWPQNVRDAKPYVVCTGGEPLLQLDESLVQALHKQGFEVAVETNGTLSAPPSIDWICVSPKANIKLELVCGDELKLVFPQNGNDPEIFEGLAFKNFYLQPMDGPDQERNVQRAITYCLEHPKWKLSLQTHKILNLP